MLHLEGDIEQYGYYGKSIPFLNPDAGPHSHSWGTAHYDPLCRASCGLVLHGADVDVVAETYTHWYSITPKLDIIYYKLIARALSNLAIYM
jgi:hypothetical protein